MQTLRFFASEDLPEAIYNGLEVAKIIKENNQTFHGRSYEVVLSNGVQLAAFLDELYIQEG